MKPNFRNKWRKPKGIHSKVRLSKKGNVGLMRIGMSKGSKKVKINLVHNVKELKKGEEAVIARIGLKKKKKIIEEAKKLGIKILNVDINKFFKKIEEMEEKKKRKKGKKENEVKKGMEEEKIKGKKEENKKDGEMGEEKLEEKIGGKIK